MILLDEILSRGQLIIPALMLAIDLSFLLGSFKLNQSDKLISVKKKKINLSSIKRKMKSESEVALLCLTPCDPGEGSLPGSAIHGIFQARILEWAAISFSRGSSQPRDRTWVSCVEDRRFTV